MVKHTQTICRLLSTDCFSFFDYFVGLALKGLIRAEKFEDFRSLVEKNYSMGALNAPKMKCPIKDLVTFTEQIFNGKLHFFV